MKQTRVITESWSIPFFPFWDLFSLALCLRVNYNTSRCFSCFTWGKKGGEKRGREGLSERSYCTGWSQMMLCHQDRIFPFLSSNTRMQVLTDFCLSDSCIFHSSACRGFSLFIASWFWKRQLLGCARGHCSNISSWVTGKGEERDRSGKVHQNEACVKKNYESLWSCNSD